APTLLQAHADIRVAFFLIDQPIEGSPYSGKAAVDAAMAKLQQASEKALKGAILALAADASGLVFHPHRLFTDDDLPHSTAFRAMLDRISKIYSKPKLRYILMEIESFAPSGLRHAEIADGGAIISLPLNTEYPYMLAGGFPTAPFSAWSSRQGDVIRYSKAVDLFFRVLKGIPQLAPHLTDYLSDAL
nr:hypothetical protein [Armatimonadota bacterium]